MHFKRSLAVSSSIILPATAETILGVTVFSRHGDRSSKHYSGYSLTNLGFQQNFQVGGDYRSTYLSSNSSKQVLGISENKYVPSQIYASAPDQMVLLNTATAFLQGLYPPLESLDASISSQTLNNGTEYSNPLNGYQYVVLHGEETSSPDTIWIKGDDGCPNLNEASEAFEESEEFQSREETTKSFYSRFWDVLQSVYDYTPEKLSYAKAYDIFDLINVASIHNSSLANNVTSEDLFQLRTLADSAEFGYNYNSSQPARSIGGQTLAGALFKQLNETVSSKGKVKFSLLAGSYDTFLAFFGVSGLISISDDFYGLPDYASTMAFEILTEDTVESFPSDTSSLRVRFLFRNGSDDGASLKTFPLFGTSEETMSWADFSSEMQKRAITTVKAWCGSCNSTQTFCLPYTSASTDATGDSDSALETTKKGGMSNAVAGVIGAMVTLGVLAIGGLGFFFVYKRRGGNATTEVPSQSRAEKGSVSSSGASH